MPKTSSTSSALAALVKELRRHGIRRYRQGSLELEFWSPAAPRANVKFNPKDLKSTMAALGLTNDPADKCVCGHSLSTEHNACGCLLGCEVAVCVSTEAAAKKGE